VRAARGSRQRGARAASSARAPGFTLLELIAVVSIIAVFSALALPSAVGQLRNRRVQEAARQIGIVYREARLRSLGRGSAVLVRITGGAITVLEARVNGTGACANAALPISSCVTPTWGVAGQQVGGFSAAASGELSTLSLALQDSGNNPITDLDICFTPMGRTFVRESTSAAQPFAPLSQTYVATVSRPGTRDRRVVLMPNGTARML
jgi:prepilin-type N-terminal cleavage/methylation domain-containing protein